MRDFKRLEVWKKSHSIALAIYRLTYRFPSEEKYGLTSQLRRSASSIGANLAEGCGRDTDKDFCRFVDIASGSATEVECHLLLARDLQLITVEQHAQLDESINEIKRMLVGLSRRLRGQAND